LLDAYEGTSRLSHVLAHAPAGELVLVVETLTPSMVTAIPERVVGIVAGNDEGPRASHAAILARGRGIPLMYAPPPVIFSAVDGELVVMDTSVAPSHFWSTPSTTKIAEARAASDARREKAKAIEREGAASIAHLGIELRVNVSSVHEAIPAIADGIGLVRTELLFAGSRRAPSEDDQLALLLAIAQKVPGRPIVVRLFDGGGDKPIAWLPHPDARGIALLRHHPEILVTQMRAITRLYDHNIDVRVLIPFTRDLTDIRAVGSHAIDPLLIGAMVETKEAVDRIDEIASGSEFISIGTNDLAASAGVAASDPKVLALVARIVSGAHQRSLPVTVCGEIAADPAVAKLLIGLSVDALSVSPPKLLPLRAALAHLDRNACVAEARATVLGAP
jgi:phosphoenolpyruvate-protein kinase (PTS system EI component)